MRAADTNVIVRLIVRDDAKQVAMAEAALKGDLWISHVVLTEVLWVLGRIYGLGQQQLAETGQRLLATAQVVVQEREVVAAALTLFAASTQVNFADCLILETARKAGQLPLATFDRGLAKLDGAERLT